MMSTRDWAALYPWKVDRGSSTPIFRQVYLQVRSAILRRAFMPGTKLPSTRELAAGLCVARASVVFAYEQLFAEGYLAGKIGSGTYVSSDLPEAAESVPAKPAKPSAVKGPRLPPRARTFSAASDLAAQNDDRPFSGGRTLVDVRTAETWRRLTNRAMRAFDDHHLRYSDPSGFIELRTAIRDYLQAARAVQCEPNQIIVTAGTQQAVDIAIRVLLRPADEAWVEDPGYPPIHQALLAAGIKLRPIPVDAHGVDVNAGIRLAPKASVVFVTPSHQFPMGVMLSMARRLELLAWARETGAWIIEDDYASEYRYSGPPLASLQGLDGGERVIYFGTLNKVLFPGLRIGYAVVPRALLKAFVGARYLMDRQPPSVSQIVLAEFMREGYLAAHIRRTRQAYRDRREALVSELGRRAGSEVAIDVPDQGIHLVAYLRGASDVAIERAARDKGVVVRAMSRLYLRARPRSGLVLGFMGFPRRMIIPAAERLAQVIRQPRR